MNEHATVEQLPLERLKTEAERWIPYILDENGDAYGNAGRGLRDIVQRAFDLGRSQVAPSTVGASSEDAELIRLLHQRYQDSGDATARKAAWRLEELTQAPSSFAASNLMVTKGDGLALPDQASALDEFKLQCRLGAMYRLLQAIVDSDNQQSRSKNADMLAKDIADVARAPRVAPSATPAASSIGGKDGRCPTCLNALTPGAHALLTQIQDDRAILALIEEVEALRRGVGVTHGDGNDPAMLLKRVVGTREDVDRREAIYREAVAHEKSLPAPADAEAKAFGEGILAAAEEVAKHWNDGTTMVNQRAQAMRSAEALRSLPLARSATTDPCTETDLCRAGWLAREHEVAVWKARALELEGKLDLSATRSTTAAWRSPRAWRPSPWSRR